MHAVSSYRGNKPSNKHSHKPTNRQDRLQYIAPQLARSVANTETENTRTEYKLRALAV